MAQDIEPLRQQQAPSVTENKVLMWGVGVGVRMASIPFVGESSNRSDFLPLLYYEDEYFYLDGLEGGIKLIDSDTWQVRLLGRWRFFDIPDEYDDQVNTDTLDWGAEFRYQLLQSPLYVEVDLMADARQRLSSQWQSGFESSVGSVTLNSHIGVRFKDARFNDYYYGLNADTIGSGMDVIAGVEARYPLLNEIFLLGAVELTRLGDAAQGSRYVADYFQENIFLGVSYQEGITTPSKSSLDAKPFLRLSHGWATGSDLHGIFSLNRDRDVHNNQLTSLLYGQPLADDLFGIPIQTYLTPGAVWHWASGVQDARQEYIIAFKSFYTFTWPFTWRFGLGEGLSYATQVSYIEQREMDEKDMESSHWLLYLDFSVDVNLGKLFEIYDLTDVWLGYAVHHRSGVFGAAPMFGDVEGGSNYNALYLQYHF